MFSDSLFYDTETTFGDSKGFGCLRSRGQSSHNHLLAKRIRLSLQSFSSALWLLFYDIILDLTKVWNAKSVECPLGRYSFTTKLRFSLSREIDLHCMPFYILYNYLLGYLHKERKWPWFFKLKKASDRETSFY